MPVVIIMMGMKMIDRHHRQGGWQMSLVQVFARQNFIKIYSLPGAATSSAAAPHQILRLLDMEAAPAQAEFNSKAVSPPLKQEEEEE